MQACSGKRLEIKDRSQQLRSGSGSLLFYAGSIDRLGIAVAWGWQWESTVFYASQGDIAFTQRIEVIIKAIEVVSLSALIEGEFEPLHILPVAAVGCAGKAWVFLDDPLGVPYPSCSHRKNTGAFNASILST